MTLLAIPFGVSTGRRGALYAIGLGIVLALGYWIVTSLFVALGKSGLLDANPRRLDTEHRCPRRRGVRVPDRQNLSGAPGSFRLTGAQDRVDPQCAAALPFLLLHPKPDVPKREAPLRTGHCVCEVDDEEE